jgi:hypothetical protein
MASVKQSRVRSGFDVEALLGERYLQMLLGTALDAGVIPPEATFGDTAIYLGMIPNEFRLYQPTPRADGDPRLSSPEAFKTEILFGHPLGANVKVRAMFGLELANPTVPYIDFTIYAAIGLDKKFDEETGALSNVGMTVHVVDIESSAMTEILDKPDPEPDMTKDELLAKVQAAIDRPADRPIDMGGASKFKKVEDLDIKWHEGDSDHPPCLGVYINVRMRNGDPDEDFLPRRGDLAQARNFLPKGEDMAMASRPGMYADMAKHVFSSTAVEVSPGNFEHAWHKSLLNPDSERIGDLNSVKVLKIPPIGSGTSAIPQNGLRIQIDGEYIDPIDLTNTDVTMTIDLRPKRADDGSLAWDTNFDVDVDALFEFTTIWAATLLGILFGPAGALYFLGAVFLVELGVGIGITLYKEGSVQEKADATLADVIPDRLTISTRRWDPFYATLHQVVTKPSQAEFNSKGFMMCGKAFIGRELVPPDNTFIRDETRDANGVLTGMRYQIADFEKVKEESVMSAAGVSRRSFTPATDAEPELWALSLDQFKERMEDSEGPLVLTKIPYFQAYVYIREHQINQLLCISGYEVETLQKQIRAEAKQRGYDRIKALEGDQITQDVIADLGPGAAQEEIDAEVEKRIQKKLKKVMDKYHSPAPLRLARDGSMEPLLRFDLSPKELVLLRDKKVIVVDDGQLKTIHGRKVLPYIRDIRFHGEEEEDDNLLSRPRYRPTAEGPVFR